MAKRLRAAVVGLGMMGRHHVRVLTAMDNVDLVGVADPLGDQYGSARGLATTSALAEIANVADLDLCVVAAPTSEHTKLAQQLASLGVATLIEKPLAASIAECDAIIDAFAANDTLAVVGHIERFNPAIQALNIRLADGLIGAIVQIATRRQGPRPDRVRDVGVVRDLATHDFDLVPWIANSPYAYLDASISSHHDTGSADLLVAAGKLDGGVLVSHIVNWCSPVKERVTIVTGTEGTLVADTLNADLIIHAPGVHQPEWEAVQNERGVSEGDVTRIAIPKREPLLTELEAFCESVRSGAPSEVATLAEGRAAVERAEICLTSANAT